MKNGTKQYRLGIDIGGTFTDFSLYDTQACTTQEIKVRTDTTNPADGVIEGLKRYAATGVDLGQVDYLIHGMTIGLNTLLQRQGAQLGLLVTKGFRDILNIQRLRLPVPYDFASRLPTPLIPRANVFPITERLDAAGHEREPIDFASVDVAAKSAMARGLSGVVVTFLHSYSAPQHEQAVKSYLNANYPQLDVELSSDISRAIGEYERTILAVINLYIKQSVKTYLTTLTAKVETQGVGNVPLVTKSNSGITSIATAVARPVDTLFSGPAAGILGASQVAKATGNVNAITVDIGGTSADISLIDDGKVALTRRNAINGFPITAPGVELYSIGAGGGSYAWLDQGGMLKVGPSSAGAYPGPAAYGSGDKPTLTDAFITANFLNLADFAGGSISLDAARARTAVGHIATAIGSSIETAASKIIDVVIANMTTELSSILSQRGINPREYSLVSYGGAGPVLANYLADELNLKNVVLPKAPGTLCALGSLYADYLFNDATVYFKHLDAVDAGLEPQLTALAKKGEAWLAQQQQAHVGAVHHTFSINARYVGQTLEIRVPIEEAWLKTPGQFQQEVRARFDALYLRQYNHNSPDKPIELTQLAIQLRGETPKPTLAPPSTTTTVATATTRHIVLNGAALEAQVFQRNQLASGQTFNGPAVVDQPDTTILVLPGWQGRVAADQSLILERSEPNGNE